MNLPSVGKMVRVQHPEHGYDIWVEIMQHRSTAEGYIIDCLWYGPTAPVPLEMQKSHMKRTISAIEIGRVLSVRQQYREITYEDQDGFSDKKRFRSY